MNSKRSSLGMGVLVSAATLLLTSTRALSDDTEIFFSQPAETVQANILLIIDTSGSMNETAKETLLPYDPTFSYSNSGTSCDSSRIYISTSSEAPSSCSGLKSFSASNLKCQAALAQLEYGAGKKGSGFFSDTFIRWRGSGSSRTWSSNLDDASGSTTASDIECKADAGVHGADGTSSAKWPRSGNANQSSGRWTSTESQSWWSVPGNSGKSVTLYSPNYIRYIRNGSKDVQTRMDVVKAAAASFLNALPNVNLGVMRYSTNSHQYGTADSTAAGGMVMSPVSPLNDKRDSLIQEITTSDKFLPHGYTPLSETLFEAYRYFSGGEPEFGLNSQICTRVDTAPGSNGTCYSSAYMQSYPSVASSMSGGRYLSPASQPCQANYIVYLTDGLPYKDTQADALIKALPNFAARGGSCLASGTGPNTQDKNAGLCLGALAQYMFNSDLRPDVQGQQNVKTYFIGFGDDFSGNLDGAFEYLQNAAVRGGGQAYQANDLASLTSVFNAIVTSIFQTSTTFTTPTVAVNAFNRTQTLDDLFVSVFQPNFSLHWPGNLKKYRVEDGKIMDNSNPSKEAVDPDTGFFADSARSFWSTSTDGPQVTEGGAASRLPDPSNRNLYTYLGDNPDPSSPVNLSSGNSHKLSTANTDLTDATFGLGSPGDPTLSDLIDWARGADLRNEDGDASTTVRRAMGDPIHSPPAVVVYGGTTANPNLNDAVVYVTTNDGYLHAIDAVTGNELWAFVPKEFLPNLKNLYFDDPVPAKQYTLDGEIRVLKYDVNGDGIVDSSAGDRVILYFGQGRGGSKYYAMDVTSKTNPKFMWAIDSTTLTGIGEAWSTPVITRVNISGKTQNSQKLVLVIGGGYDPAQNGSVYVAADTVGNRIYMVDALRGTLLWSAGHTSSTADFKSARMTHSIPASVAVLDTNSDGYADRMYVGDMAAQLWRFDITNGNTAANLVAGGVIASLGPKGAASDAPDDASPAAARRFYSSPDVSLIQRQGTQPFFNIAIGSGYRGHPLNTAIQDRFYAIRDYSPLAKMTQAQYDSYSIILDNHLVDITEDVKPTIPANSPGWKLRLDQPGNSWVGEKSLNPSNTFDNKIFFTTYLPPSGTSAASCGATSTGSNRAYVVNALDGSPVRRRDAQTGEGETGEDEDGDLTPEDRYEELRQGGIAPEVAFLFPEKDEVVCLSGVEVLSICKNFNSRIKTYWRESSAP